MPDICFLVIDNSRMVRSKVRNVLENRLGVELVIEAADGAEAIKVLQAHKIDMIISDWDMPGLNGEELLFEVRNNRQWSAIPFIMMTGNKDRDCIVSAMQNGVSNYIVKPFSPAELEDKIRKSWNKTSRRRAERYNMQPEHKAAIRYEDAVFSAQILNISRTGALVRVNYDQRLRLFEKYQLMIELKVAGQSEPMRIDPIYGATVRLEVEDYMQTSSLLSLMGLAFIPSLTSQDVADKLDSLITYLRDLQPNAVIGNE